MSTEAALPQVSVQIPMYYQNPLVSTEHNFYISEDIGDPALFVDLIHALKCVPATDKVFIYLNTRGGLLDTTLQIVNAIRGCSAEVTTVLEGYCLSAGTLILLAGHNIVINPNTRLMIHMYSGGAWGKGSDLTREVTDTDSWVKGLYLESYAHFLDHEEIQDVFKGADIWMHYEEITKRLSNLTSHRLKVEEQDTKEALDSIRKSLEV